jgi:hypothetical protein
MVAFADTPLEDTDDLQTQLGPDSVGQPHKVSLLRGGEPKTITVTVGNGSRRASMTTATLHPFAIGPLSEAAGDVAAHLRRVLVAVRSRQGGGSAPSGARMG